MAAELLWDSKAQPVEEFVMQRSWRFAVLVRDKQDPLDPAFKNANVKALHEVPRNAIDATHEKNWKITKLEPTRRVRGVREGPS